MKNINLVKGMLTLLLVQLISTSMLYAANTNNSNSTGTRGVPIDKVVIALRFSEQTTTSVKVSWDPVATVTNYHLVIDGGTPIDLGTATEYVVHRVAQGSFTVQVDAWKMGGTNELIGASETVTTTTVQKMPGYAISWDKTNPIDSVRLSIPQKIIKTASDFTVEFWLKAEIPEDNIFKISTAGGFGMHIEKDGDLIIFDGTAQVASATGIIDIQDPLNPPVVAPPPALPPVTPPHIRDGVQSSWQHIAIVYQSSVGYTIYKDGEEFALLKPSTTPSSTWNDFSLENIKGQFDELRIWRVARSAAEIKAFAFSTVDTAVSTALKLYYRFDQAAGAVTAIDLTGNGFDSVINKGAVSDVVVPSYAMVRAIAMGAYKDAVSGAVVLYWKDSNIKPIVPSTTPLLSIFTVYISTTAGDYSTLIGGSPFVFQKPVSHLPISHSFSVADLDPALTYYIKIAVEDKLTYSGADYKAVQSAYSVEVKYDPAVVTPPVSYEGPINSVLFDADSVYAMVANSPASLLSTTDFTVETWFKSTKNSGVLLASKDSISSSARGWDISLSGGVPILNLSDGTSQETVPAGNTPVVLNQWNHIAFVRENGVVTPYLNTVALSTQNSALDISRIGGLSFGNYNAYNVAKSFIGELDEVRIFNASRTPAEIKAHSFIPASADFTSPTFSLIAYYKCNRDTATILKDELGANASLFGNSDHSKAQSEAMGCPMSRLQSNKTENSFDANWNKPNVIIQPEAIHYSVEVSNNPLFDGSGNLYYDEEAVTNFDTETLARTALPNSQEAHFYKVSTIYDLGVDTNGDGNIDADDLLKRFSKTTALQLNIVEPVPGRAYTQVGTSNLTSLATSPIDAAIGTSLTTSVWFNTSLAPLGHDFKKLLRIYDNNATTTRLQVRLHDDRIKIQTSGTEVDNGVLGLQANRWYCVTVVWGAVDSKVYLDGAFLYASSSAKLAHGAKGSAYVLESDFVGSLDDLKIWKRNLTEQEVKDQMNFEIIDPSLKDDLIAYYDFNIQGGPYLADLTQHGVDLEVKDSPSFDVSYALGCPLALPFKDVDYAAFTAVWQESVDWGVGPLDPRVQTYDYDLDFKSKGLDGSLGTTTVSNATALPDGVNKLDYLVTSLDTSAPEAVELDPSHEYFCTVKRSLTNPFTGQVEVRSSVEVSSKLRRDAPGECLNLLGADDTLTLPTTLPALGNAFTVGTWVKFGPPVVQRYSFAIDAAGLVTRETSKPVRAFIFEGSGTGSPFLAADWVINAPAYKTHVQLLFYAIAKDGAGKVILHDLNGNVDPNGTYLKSGTSVLLITNNVVPDTEFNYTNTIVSGARLVTGFKNGADKHLQVDNGFLQDYDVLLGVDAVGAAGGELLGEPSERARWYNLVMTYDSTTVKLYVDGLSTTLSGDSGAYDRTSKITTLGSKFNGFIEEFTIWDELHSAVSLKAQRYTELDIEGVHLLDPIEKAAAEARRIERNGITDAQFAHVVCYLPFSASQKSGSGTINNAGFMGGHGTLVHGEAQWLTNTLENTVCWPDLTGNSDFICRFFPCIRMSYNSRIFDGATTTPDESTVPGLIPSGLTLTDGNPVGADLAYTYTTAINPHAITNIDGRLIPTRYLTVMWGLADASLKSKQVTQQSWFVDNSGLTSTDPLGKPFTYDMTFDMKAISPEVYDINYTGPNTSGMTDEQKQEVRDKFDALTGEDFQLLFRPEHGPILTPADIYKDLTDLYAAPTVIPGIPAPPVDPNIPVITINKIGSEGTRGGTSFTVTFSGVPRVIGYEIEDKKLNIFNAYFYTNAYYALGMSVSLSDMILTPVTGLNSEVTVNEGVATINWSVVTETGVKMYILEKLDKDGKWITVGTVASDQSLNYSLDDPNYEEGDEYRVTTVDINGISQSFPIGSAADSIAFITLDLGWNLISVPLDNADLSGFKNLTDGTFWDWDGQSYQALSEDPKALQGFWVFSLVKNFPVKVTGSKTKQTELELATGWNLKGPSENTYFDDSSITVYSWAKAYSGSTEKSYVMVSEAVNQILEGHGYWIFNLGPDKTVPLEERPLK